MLANVDIIISAIAVCIVSTSVPESVQPWRWFWCWDLLLFLSAIAAYALMAKRFKPAADPSKRVAKKIDSLVVEHCTEVVVSRSVAADTIIVETSTEQLGLLPEVVLSHCVAPDTIVVDSSIEKQHLPDASEKLALMQKYASERDIKGTFGVFRELENSGVQLNSAMYNAVLQAWISCGNVAAAEDWMEDMKKAGMVDVTSCGKLIKAFLVTHQREKAIDLMEEMRNSGIQPTVDIFNELLNGCAHDSSFDDGLELLDSMHDEGIKPNIFTLDAVVKMLNSARNLEHKYDSVLQIVRKYEIDPHVHNQCFKLACASLHADRIGVGDESSISPLPLTLPRIAAVILHADYAMFTQSCIHEVHVTGSLSRVKAARRSFKQFGFLDKDDDQTWPLNGHWETEHGLTVVIEGKMVRWSRQRASKLRFAGLDRSECILTVYGEAALGRLITPGSSPGAIKTLRWDNGDVWHSYDGRVVGHAALFAQTMTKTLRDETQDEAYRAKYSAIIAMVSKQGLKVPAAVMDHVLLFLGHDLYYVRVRFESKWSPDADFYDVDEDIMDTISRRHPRVGLRHCWADQSISWCGQRTLVHGENVEEESFNRHISAVWRM